MAKVLLTGASGFIGEALIKELVGQGHEVITACRNDLGVKQPGSAHITIDFASLQAQDPSFWKHVIQDNNIDCIVNAAAVVRGKPEVFEKVNHLAPKVMLEAADELSAERSLPIRVVQLSTAEAHSPYADELDYTRTKKALFEDMQKFKNLSSFVLGINVVFDRGDTETTDPRMRYFEALAKSAYPAFPGSGSYEIQPIARQDVAKVITGLLRLEAQPETADKKPNHIEYIPALGPYPMSIAEIVGAIREGAGKSPVKVKNIPNFFAKFAALVAEFTSFHVANKTFLEMAEMSQKPDSGVTGSCARLEEASDVSLTDLRTVYGAKERFPKPALPEGWKEHKPGVMLITGGTGMVGKRIIEYAKEQGFKIVCTSRRSFQGDGTIQYIQADMESPAFHSSDVWKKLIQEYGVTHVVEAAGIFDGKRDQMRNVNRKAPQALAKGAEEAGVERYVQVTSYNMNDECGNPVWDDYRELNTFLKDQCRELNWVEVAPTHIYASKPGESHIPYHVMAAAAIHFNLKSDTLMQPIHVHDLAKGIVNLSLNKSAKHERLPAVGPESIYHNQFLDTIQTALGIPGRDTVVTLGPKTALKIATFNEFLHKSGMMKGLHALTRNTVAFNLSHSTGSANAFETAAGIRQPPITEHFQRDARDLLRDFVNWKRLFQIKIGSAHFNTHLMHRVDPFLMGKIEGFGAQKWRVTTDGTVKFTYSLDGVPLEVMQCAQMLQKYCKEHGGRQKRSALGLGPVINNEHQENEEKARSVLQMTYGEMQVFAALMQGMKQHPEWADEADIDTHWEAIKATIHNAAHSKADWKRAH